MMAEFPITSVPASNQVGDAMMLYSLVHGPLWQRAKELSPETKQGSEH